LLDSWLLALGLSPFSASAREWRDAPAADLAPLTLLQRAWIAVRHPFGAALETSYARVWDDDAQAWRQTARHRLATPPGPTLELATTALIDPERGAREIETVSGGRRQRFTLVEIGSAGDVGVPDTLSSAR